MKRTTLVLAALALGVMMASGCAGKKKVEEIVSSAPGPQGDKGAVVVPDERPLSESVDTADIKPEGLKTGEYRPIGKGDQLTKLATDDGTLYTVHFDYDKYSVREEDQKLLETNAKWLKLNPTVKIRIEGYADERGETEYNLALGDKRARSVARFLGDMGVMKDELSTISYGEESPVDPAHNEDAWARNRRAEFRIVR